MAANAQEKREELKIEKDRSTRISAEHSYRKRPAKKDGKFIKRNLPDCDETPSLVNKFDLLSLLGYLSIRISRVSAIRNVFVRAISGIKS